ncbi:MAG: hypothetical protein [Bacteriophage sp.]|nr:MAG: hypothetical protein [Bacteriophage sp.]
MSDERVTFTTQRNKTSLDKYTEDMPDLLIDYFNVDVTDYLDHNHTTAQKSNHRVKPEGIPSILKFCQKYGIARSTFYTWPAAHPEFREATEIAKAMHEEIIMNIGLATNGQFSNFMLRCNFGWNDKESVKPVATAARPVKIVMKRMSDQRKEEIREQQAQAQEEDDNDA